MKTKFSEESIGLAVAAYEMGECSPVKPPRKDFVSVPKDSKDQLYTVKEACALLRIGTTKFYEMAGDGRLDVVRLGNRCTRVKKSSIDRLINGA